MAASSVPESMPGTPTPPAITPPGTDSQSALRNLKLNHEWTMGEPIPRGNERHATIYSVLISETGQPSEDLEAHVFALDGTETKLRKHRQRCIKRMEGRTKLKLEVDAITIIVITTSQTGNADALEHGVEPCPMSKEGQQETDGGTSSIEERKQKSPYQLESQRIRQKERRQARRSARTRQRNERTIDGEHKATESIDQVNSLDGKNDLSMFVFLLLELVHAWGPSTATPSKYIDLAMDIDSGCVYDINMLKDAVSLQTVENIESYLKIRRSEIISLRRYQTKISRAEAYHLDKLISIKREPAQDKEASDQVKRSKDDSGDGSEAKAKDQLKLARLANSIIGNLLLSRKSIIRLVERKIPLADGEMPSDELRAQPGDLEQQLSQYKGWISTVVAFEVADAYVLRLMEWAQIRMRTWEASFLKVKS